MKLNTKGLAGVEYGFVVLATGSYLAHIETLEVNPNKEGTGHNCDVKLKILDRIVINAEGKEVENRGNIYAIKHIGMQASEKYDPDRVIKELAVACGVPKDFDGDVTDTMLQGGIVIVKLRYVAPKEGYPEKHDVMGWLPPNEEQLALGRQLVASNPY